MNHEQRVQLMEARLITRRHIPRGFTRLAIAAFGASMASLMMGLFIIQCAGQASAAEVPRRIIAAGGAITEILYALSLQDRIIGVDTTSLHPEAALKDKPNVGYVRALSAEGVLSLKPDLVLAIPNSGPPDTLKLIEAAGVRIVQVPDDASAEGAVTKVIAVGRLTGEEAKAKVLAADIGSRFAVLERQRVAILKPKRVLFVLALQNGRPMVGGRNSSADAIIRLAGGINVADSIEGYKPMSDEAVIAAAPDIVVMMARGQHAVNVADVFAQPSFAATPAAATRNLVVMDGLYLLGFGPRAPDAARDLMAHIYPDKAAELANIRP